MLRVKYDPIWKYADIYDDDKKIATINYVESFEVALEEAMKFYQEYKGLKGTLE